MATNAGSKIELAEDSYPLSPMQQGMLFHNLRAPEAGTDICQIVADLPEEIDAALFEQAWQHLAEHHPILQTSFSWEGEPRQHVHRQAKIPVARRNWRGLTIGEQAAQLETVLNEEVRRGFDLAVAPLLRVILIQRNAADFQFVWTYHHILLDARSLELLLNDFFEIYEALRKGAAPALSQPRPYRHYIEWVQQQDWSKARAFWQEHLKGFTASTPLPASALPQGVKASEAGSPPTGEKQIEISQELTSTLRVLAQRNGLTVTNFVQGAWGLLLSRYSSEAEVVFGAVRACRHSSVEGAEGMTGLFINTLPVRLRVNPETALLPWLREIRQQWLDLRPVEHTPLVRIQGWSEVPAGAPLFESILNVQDPSWDSELRAQRGKWARRQFRMRNQPGYPLALDVYSGDTLVAKACYDRRHFQEETITRLLSHFQTLLEAMIVHPKQTISSLPMLSEAERHQLLVEWNQTERVYPRSRCVQQLFEEQAERTPDALALSGTKTQLTYRELNQRANQLAHRLRASGVSPDALVGVYAERSAEMVLGQLAILKAGGAYVPIDPAYPAERVLSTIEDAGILIVLGQEKLLDSLPPLCGAADARAICLEEVLSGPIDSQHTGNPITTTSPKNLAYVIYTSGSTGRPKGVELEHAGLVNLIAWHQRTYEIAPADRATQLAGPAFDASVWELWPYLTAGASVHIPGPEIRLSPKSLLQWLAAEKITICFLPTPLAEAVMDEDWPKDAVLRTLLTGGDRLRRRPSHALPCPVINHYGPTEITVVATAALVTPGEAGAPTIGRPIANTTAYVLDRDLQPVPIGAPGELYIGGAGLARAYLNCPELTAEKFIPHPFSKDLQARLYKTGDRVRFHADGSLEFLGRIDQQVKIRGYRIEPGEIESVLLQHPDVREAAVIARDDFAGESRLVAYTVASIEPVPDGEALREFLRTKFPEYMVPSSFVWLKELPVTANGKIDRKALPKPEQEPDADKAFVAPRTPTEEMLAGIWAETLHLSKLGVHHNFFQLGGHSLLATQIIARVHNAFGVQLGVQELFDSPTVASLGQIIERQTRAPHPSPPLRVSRSPQPATDSQMPLSFAQERLWFLEQMEPGQAFNNIPVAFRIKGALDAHALQSSLSEIVRRHAVFRTTFANQKGRPTAVVSCADGLPLPLIGLVHLPEEQRETEARRLAEAEAQLPFDLSRSPLLRVKLLEFDAADHLLLITTHHLVSDGWSMAIFYRELQDLYEAFSRGSPSPLPEVPLQYGDFVRWQRESLQGELFEEQLAYWKQQLKGRLPPLELPADRPRPPLQTYHGKTHFFTLPSSLYAALKKLSRREDATLFMLLVATFQTLLHRYSGQEDVIVGSPVAGRSLSESERMMGLFLNTLVLRTDLSGDPTFRELLKRVRKVALGAYAHQDLPFEKLVESLPMERDLSRSPIFQVMFVLQPAPFQSAERAGLTLTPIPISNGAAKFDLTLSLEELPDGLTGSLEYNTDLFDSATILRLLGHFQTLLEGIVQNPNQPLSALPILTAGERQQMLLEWNKTAADYPKDKCIHQLFEEQVERTPGAPAAVFEGEQLTYRELNDRANHLARHLQSLGVGPEVRVGICLARSLDMLVGLLAILKAGGCYLPLDPAYPKERLGFMLEDAQAPVLLTEQEFASGFSLGNVKVVSPHHLPGPVVDPQLSGNPSSGVTPENLAYVIYTSGSTGKPKGVMLRHRNVANFFTGMDERLGTQPGVWLAVTSISFDISVLELFWTLTRGFKVVIHAEQGGFRVADSPARAERKLDFSLCYFASHADSAEGDKYKLLIEGAKFADQNGLAAVWTPERHFQPFGGLFPNPAVTSAALAMITKHVQLRAGSVVLPLHDPIAVVEQWAVVDNLSQGRTALSFASGWHPDDFVLAPQNYARRKEIMQEQIQTVRKLWRGESIQRRGGAGERVDVRIFPKPIQRELPVWITSAGTSETFRLAGELGVNLLTHLSGQSLEELGKKIEIYRTAWRGQRHPQKEGCVSLMLHTFIWENADFAWEKVRQPLQAYLKTCRDLSRNGQPAPPNLSPARQTASIPSTERAPDIEALLNKAVDRYLGTTGLFGAPKHCLQMISKLKAIGVDEVACLVDFGVEPELVLKSLQYLKQLKEPSQHRSKTSGPAYTLPEQIARHGVTHLQCTPSLAAMLIQEPEALKALRSVQKLLLGGEALPTSLVKQLEMPGRVLNMYGPTETTVWSTSYEVGQANGAPPIGRPIANTEIYILDRQLQPVPPGVAGELLIGGAGVARGYLNRPELTAEKFIPHPFSSRPGARLYRTGDSARYLADGTIEFLGRVDQQVKLRGFRIELGEIESILCEHPQVREAVVVLREFSAGDKRLVAYLVPQPNSRAGLQPATPNVSPAISEQRPANHAGKLDISELRAFLKKRLPDYMVPAGFEVLEQLPLTPNGKVDRKALPELKAVRALQQTNGAPLQNEVEKKIAGVWQKLLHVEQIGPNDNFFDLGGHSLLVVQAQAQLSDAFQVELSILQLFQYPTIRSLAKFFSEEQKEKLPLQKIRDRARRQRTAFDGRRRALEALT